ncbi:hypothetical protein [Nonomuraea insulae]|uniref:Uncharacterized protein n=1 Tax=Nonomuraea insulae TaxID=1616787 RepID=A0ABW1CDJ5_9ACTN
MRKILLALAAVLVACWLPVPAAAAGNWAVTYVDPAPARFAGGQSYALGFWVLQHGTHPFEGKMSPVGLRFTRADGKSVEFGGTALPEAGHYATSVVLEEGVWRVEGVQGPFQPYQVGTLTVPGSLRIDPVPADLAGALTGANEDYWDAVRPPLPAPASATVQEVATAAPRVEPQPRDEESGVPAWTLLLAVAGGAVLAVGALRLPRLRRRRTEEPDPPVDASAETIVISG